MIVPVFLMNKGCPQRCIFCNIRQISGPNTDPPTENHLRRQIASYISFSRRKPATVELAFYGGNFTGMPRREQEKIFGITDALRREQLIQGIRISTRPDDLDSPRLLFLQAHGVKTIEIGAQSMADHVLRLSERGHTAQDVRTAVRLARSFGMSTGVHLMAGLPGDTPAYFADTVMEVIALKPDMVRLHPTLVFAETLLAEMYHNGCYTPLELSEAINLCKTALIRFEKASIPVIRLGLQKTETMEEGNIIAGPFHPAFRSIVESAIFLDMAAKLLERESVSAHKVSFTVAPQDLSSFRGNKNANILSLRNRFPLSDMTILTEAAMKRGTLALSAHNRCIATLHRSDFFP
jgi:histone acetyltransferase (RNA polymerase elongator complex component)